MHEDILRLVRAADFKIDNPTKFPETIGRIDVVDSRDERGRRRPTAHLCASESQPISEGAVLSVFVRDGQPVMTNGAVEVRLNSLPELIQCCFNPSENAYMSSTWECDVGRDGVMEIDMNAVEHRDVAGATDVSFDLAAAHVARDLAAAFAINHPTIRDELRREDEVHECVLVIRPDHWPTGGSVARRLILTHDCQVREMLLDELVGSPVPELEKLARNHADVERWNFADGACHVRLRGDADDALLRSTDSLDLTIDPGMLDAAKDAVRGVVAEAEDRLDEPDAEFEVVVTMPRPGGLPEVRIISDEWDCQSMDSVWEIDGNGSIIQTKSKGMDVEPAKAVSIGR